MGSKEEELDKCWKLIQKDGNEYYEYICKKKHVLLLSGTGIVGPKFKVEISGPDTDVTRFLEVYFEMLKGYRA